MSNVIAVIWDFDKTLIDGYMQEPIFKKYGVDPARFWAEVDALPQKYAHLGVRVNRDTIYLNHFIKLANNGTMPGLNNDTMKEFGKELSFYSGVPEIFEKTKALVSDYSEYNIRVEHYIVSTGMAQIIRGSRIMEYVTDIWGCELIDAVDEDGTKNISEVVYTIDNTSKTRAIFEINKGVTQRNNLDVNSTVPAGLRRVPFENMIYIADGPSDIPAFSLINKNGGSTFAIYPEGDEQAMNQVEKMRADGRINMYAIADYSENKTAYLWIKNKILSIAERIRDNERAKLNSVVSPTPTHLP